MNVLNPKKAARLYWLFSYGRGIRESARLAGVHRDTATRYRREWLRFRPQLQRAYDVLWEGDGEGCDAITAPLPDQMVIAMLDAWQDDQMEQQPLSGWHAGYEDAPQETKAAAGEDENSQPRQVQGEPQEP